MGGKQYDTRIDQFRHLCELPWLVQRLKAPLSDHGTGLDKYFLLDYMGAAEFEWGALPGSLKVMRAAKGMKKWEPFRLTAHDGDKEYLAWYVGSEETKMVALEFFDDQLRERPKWSLKERSCIRNSYFPEHEWDGKIIGWWAVDGGPVPWAIFMKKEDAENFLKGLRESKK